MISYLPLPTLYRQNAAMDRRHRIPGNPDCGVAVVRGIAAEVTGWDTGAPVVTRIVAGIVPVTVGIPVAGVMNCDREKP